MKHALLRLAVLALIAAVPAAVAADVTVADRLAPGSPPLVIAHRTADVGELQENTLAWIGAEIAKGVDAIHVNPQVTADGAFVLMHDPTLNRLTDVTDVFPEGPPGGPTRDSRQGRDYVGDYTLDELRQLEVFDAAGSPAGRIPTLAEALAAVDGRALVLLGLYNYDADSLAAALAGLETANLLLFDLYYTGTDMSRLRDLGVRTGIDAAVALYQSRDALKDLDGIAGQLGPALRMVFVRSLRVTPDFVARAEDLGVLVGISGFASEDIALIDRGDPEPWRAALDSGFSALTDAPGLVLGLLGR